MSNRTISKTGWMIVAALFIAIPQFANAQVATTPQEDTRLLVKGVLGFGSSGKLEADRGAATRGDMDPTFGGFVELDFPVHRYFTLGGLAGALFYNSEDWASDDIGYSTSVHLDIVPKARFPIAESFELYVAVPVGLTLNFLSSDLEREIGGDISMGVGFNLQILVGGLYMVSESLGVFADASYVYMWASHNADGGMVNSDFSASYGQFMFQLGVVVSL